MPRQPPAPQPNAGSPFRIDVKLGGIWRPMMRFIDCADAARTLYDVKNGPGGRLIEIRLSIRCNEPGYEAAQREIADAAQREIEARAESDRKFLGEQQLQIAAEPDADYGYYDEQDGV